jgi:3',5'-cyclic AMP phosphodiesterase CpdA
MILLHISDTHFGTEQPPVTAALLALARERRPDALIFSGDITQRARRGQFSAAWRFCQELAIRPMLALPGNHDIPLINLPMRLLAPYAGFRRAFGDELEPVIDHPEFLAIGVNTTRWWRHKNGEVSREQVEQVAQRLRGARPNQLRLVVTHQPSAVLRESDVHDRLRGGPQALQTWAQAGADLVLGGHIHLPFIVEVAPGGARPLWCVQAGTAVSHRVRHDTCNSVNLIHWHPPVPGAARTCRVERCDYHMLDKRFLTADNRLLALG